jgi:hypothetical protein
LLYISLDSSHENIATQPELMSRFKMVYKVAGCPETTGAIALSCKSG